MLSAAAALRLARKTPARGFASLGGFGHTVEERSAGFYHLTFDRPEVHNAFNAEMIAALAETARALRRAAGLRALFVRGRGASFQAGADLKWMKASAALSAGENERDALALGAMLREFATLPCCTVALVHGNAFGGGVGLISACDVAVGCAGASFALSEARLGLIPATISPCVCVARRRRAGFARARLSKTRVLRARVLIRARARAKWAHLFWDDDIRGAPNPRLTRYVVPRIGAAQARRYFLTAERFGAERAREIGLLHEVCDDGDALEAWAASLEAALASCAPSAVAAGKELVRAVERAECDDALLLDTARRLGAQRASAEGVEGVAAFLAKRKPAWAEGRAG